jgi:hypothetical protein
MVRSPTDTKQGSPKTANELIFVDVSKPISQYHAYHWVCVSLEPTRMLGRLFTCAPVSWRPMAFGRPMELTFLNTNVQQAVMF